MKKVLSLCCFLMSLGILAQTKIIKGKVFLDTTPLKEVSISILDTQKTVLSATDGSYQIAADEGDIIQYRFMGLQTVQIFVEDVTNILNLNMYPDINELEEVTVTDRNKKVEILTQKDYNENKTYMQTTFGMVDLSKSAGLVRFLQGDKMNKGASCILDVLRGGVMPGVKVFGNCARGGGVLIRGFTSITRATPAIYDVDGIIFTDVPLWIIPTEITRIAVMSGIATTGKYGALGSSGVIVINTRTNVFLEDSSVDPSSDTARLTNNVYANDAVASASASGYGSKYLVPLFTAATANEAKSAYETNSMAISGSYFFVLDAFNHFLNELQDKDFAQKILEDNASVLQNNPVALKSLAYLYDAAGLFGDANAVYKEVFMLRPQYAQSYLDLASSYTAMGEYQKGATMLVRYDYLVEQGFLKTDEHFSKVTDRELNNLLELRGKSLITGKSKQKYVLEDGFEGTRLVLEWADSEAEFDLQFVNPENRYAKWEHTLNKNQERIQQEKRIGYNVEEYLIDDALKGTWKINITYKGNKKLTPTYLKTTVYYKYGSKLQSKEIKVFKLQSKGLNQNLLRIQNGSLVVSK